jgi:hypothetical protein
VIGLPTCLSINRACICPCIGARGWLLGCKCACLGAARGDGSGGESQHAPLAERASTGAWLHIPGIACACGIPGRRPRRGAAGPAAAAARCGAAVALLAVRERGGERGGGELVRTKRGEKEERGGEGRGGEKMGGRERERERKAGRHRRRMERGGGPARPPSQDDHRPSLPLRPLLPHRTTSAAVRRLAHVCTRPRYAFPIRTPFPPV